MISPALNRRGGLFATLGSLPWILGWIVTLIAGGGSNTERVWRTLLVNPALLVFMIGLTGVHAKPSGYHSRRVHYSSATGVGTHEDNK